PFLYNVGLRARRASRWITERRAPRQEYTRSMDQLDLPARGPDRSVGALSVDAQWVADKLSEYGFKMADLEELYPAAETVAIEWAARGDELISIDLVTGEMRRRFGLKFSNTVRPFLARMLRDRRPSLRAKIEVTTTSRGKNRNVKVAIDHLNVVAVIHRAADGTEQRKQARPHHLGAQRAHARQADGQIDQARVMRQRAGGRVHIGRRLRGTGVRFLARQRERG